MSATEWQQGDLGTYEGIMIPRRMQRVTVVGVMNDGDLGCRFPDGAVIRVSRKWVTKIIAPQHAADF